VRKRAKKNKTQGKGKQALKTTGRALKKAASSVLGAGAQILGAGSKALNPRRKKNKTIIKARRVVVLNRTAKKAAKKTEKRKRNASRAIHLSRKAKSGRARSSSVGRTTKATRSRKPLAQSRKAATKSRARKNPSPESIRKQFAGRVSGSRDLYFPQGTPQGLAKLGKLVLIQTEEGTIKPVHGSAWLCADTQERLHIGSTSNAPLFSGPARNLGRVRKIEYESSKPHLGYQGPIIWFHHMGEENGKRPTLHADGKGGLVFKGGDYRLTKRGIEN
jgi:hypothetical protein